MVSSFNRFTETEAGTYVCSAENILGAVTASILLQLKGVPAIRILQQNPYVAQTGDYIRLDCVAKETTASKSIQWHKLHQAITTYSTQVVHGSALSLTIRRVAPSDAGFYVCKSIQDDRAVEERIHVIGRTKSALDHPVLVARCSRSFCAFASVLPSPPLMHMQDCLDVGIIRWRLRHDTAIHSDRR